MICEYCGHEHAPDPFYCIARMGEKVEALEAERERAEGIEEKQSESLKIEALLERRVRMFLSSFHRIAVSINWLEAVEISKKALMKDSEIVKQFVEEREGKT